MNLRCPKCRKFIAEIKTPGVAALRVHCGCGRDLVIILDHKVTNVFLLAPEPKPNPCLKPAQ